MRGDLGSVSRAPLTLSAGGARASGGGHPGRGRGRGGGDDLEGAGPCWGRVCCVQEDRGEQGDCAVAGLESERDVYSERERERAAERADAAALSSQVGVYVVAAVVSIARNAPHSGLFCASSHEEEEERLEGGSGEPVADHGREGRR